MKDESIYYAKQKINTMIQEIEKVIIGKRTSIQLTVTALLAGGHVLFEDIPGVGKTMLVKTLAKTIHGEFTRIQFTPDLLPNDILGFSLYLDHSEAFEFKKGPIFTTVLLADEINRTTPRTQSALLEAMSEKSVTIDGATHLLSENFFVLATQNPLDYEGTYPLPEAQLDRFLFHLSIGYPSFQEEMQLISGGNREKALQTVKPVLSLEDITYLKQLVNNIHIDPLLLQYALKLVLASRKHSKVALGVSPRGAIAFVQAAKAFALTEGRSYCTPDDFLQVIHPVFYHRIIIKDSLQTNQQKKKAIIDEMIRKVSVPVKE